MAAAGAKFVVGVRRLAIALWLAVGQAVIMSLVGAKIVADPGASSGHRPTVLDAGNGVPVVNIQTPSDPGISRNVYSQFDVD